MGILHQFFFPFIVSVTHTFSAEGFQSSVGAFTRPVPVLRNIPTSLASASVSSTVQDSGTDAKDKVQDGMNTGMQYECNEDAECNLTPCPDEGCRSSLDVRIHGIWYDLSGWRKAHPAGSHWIDMYDGRDATEVMDAFHSEKARKMYGRLPKSDVDVAKMLEASTPVDTNIQKSFRKLRDDLEEDKWFDRDYIHEAKLVGILLSLFAGAIATAHTVPILSTMLLSLAFTNSGWIGHDYIHGADKFSEKMRMFSSLFVGLGPSWWANKHNNHHAHTNEIGVDGDMAEGPLLYSYAPDPANDSPMRKIQHWTMPFTFSLLFILWRFRSFEAVVPAIENKMPRAKEELYALMAHYFALFTLIPSNVWIPSMFVSGLMTAFIVTPTHQNDEYFGMVQEDWVSAQFRSTRNAVLTNPFSTWLWGGMQYQLEHHLFPTMPRSKYPKLRPIMQKFAKDNGLEYLETEEFELLRTNWELYRDVAKAEAVSDAPRRDGYLNLEAKISNKASSVTAMPQQ